MSNEFTITGVEVGAAADTAVFAELATAMLSMGPQSVKTKEFEATQFDPEKIQRLLERRTGAHPTFNNMTKVQVFPLYGDCDCNSYGRGRCQ